MRKKNALFHRFTSFVHQEVPKLEHHMGNYGNLQIAVNQTQINHLKQGAMTYVPTTADPLVNIAVQKVKASAEARRVAIDGFLQTMMSFYPNRFNWDNEKVSINLVLQNNPGKHDPLNFTNYVAIDVNKGLKEGYIDSFQRFMESLVRSAKSSVAAKEAMSEIRKSRVSVKAIITEAIDDSKKNSNPAKKIIKDRLFYRCSNSI